MAGSWGTQSQLGSGYKVTGISNTFVASASDGSIPNWGTTTDPQLAGFSGVITDIRVIFGSPAPSSLTVNVYDKVGFLLGTGTITASGSIDINSPAQVAGGISLAFSGNSTNLATATVEILFL